MWRHPRGQGRPRTPEGAWLLAHSRRRDPECIPRPEPWEMQTGPRPGVPSEEDTALWELAVRGWPVTSLRSRSEAAGEDELTAWLDRMQWGDLRDDVEGFEARLHARQLLRAALASLPERERQVLAWRMHGATLRTCGERLGVLTERARQLEARGLLRLRAMLAPGTVEPKRDRCSPTNRYGTPLNPWAGGR